MLLQDERVGAAAANIAAFRMSTECAGVGVKFVGTAAVCSVDAEGDAADEASEAERSAGCKTHR